MTTGKMQEQTSLCYQYSMVLLELLLGNLTSEALQRSCVFVDSPILASLKNRLAWGLKCEHTFRIGRGKAA